MLLLVIAPAVAFADDKAAAETAFLKAKRLMKDGKIAEACDAFAQSQKLDPQIGTQYNLALCYEQEGRTASAWVLFREVSQRDSNSKRKKDSTKRAAALEKKLTKLLMTTADTPGLVVTRNGEDVTNLLGMEDPIDPGHYTLVVSAPGYVEQTIEVEVQADKGAVVTVEIPALAKEQAEPPPEDMVEQPPPEERFVEEPDPELAGSGSPGRGRKIAGIGIAGAGVVSLGVGLVFGAKARSAWNEVESICGSDHQCDNQADYDRAQGLVSDSRSAGNLSTILVGVGAVAIAGGVILYLTAPSGGGHADDETALRIQPELGADGASVVLAGGF
jgi:hypothetical protein